MKCIISLIEPGVLKYDFITWSLKKYISKCVVGIKGCSKLYKSNCSVDLFLMWKNDKENFIEKERFFIKNDLRLLGIENYVQLCKNLDSVEIIPTKFSFNNVE